VLRVGGATAVTTDQNLSVARQRFTNHLTGFFDFDETGSL